MIGEYEKGFKVACAGGLNFSVGTYIVPLGYCGRIFCGEGNMEKANGVPIYWLGHALGQLQAIWNPSVRMRDIGSQWYWARNALGIFVDQIAGFPLSEVAARRLIGNMDRILEGKLGNLDSHFSGDEMLTIGIGLTSFQSVLSEELNKINIFYVTQKNAYDMTLMIHEGERNLPEETLALLGKSKSRVISDIREATRAYSFDLNTALGFHIYRAIEALILDDYFPALEVESKELEKQRNLGGYIKIIKDRRRDPKITTTLDHLRVRYRNRIDHPEEYWDSFDANNAIPLAVSSISLIVEDIKEISQETSSPMSQT